MVAYRTCLNCAAASAPCIRREGVRAAIKGTGITLVKFRCEDRRSIYRPGQRVSVTWTVFDEEGEDAGPERWPATIIAEVGTKFVISIDDVASDFGTPAREFIKNERLFAKVSTARLKSLDEPARAICKFCQRAPGLGDVCKETGWAPDSPPGCLAPKGASV